MVHDGIRSAHRYLTAACIAGFAAGVCLLPSVGAAAPDRGDADRGLTEQMGPGEQRPQFLPDNRPNPLLEERDLPPELRDLLAPRENPRTAPNTLPPEEAGKPLAPPAPTKADAKAVLAGFYEQLRAAPNAEAAGLIATAIERLWLNSGSPTVDLIMERASQLLSAEQAARAIALLNAAVAFAPDYPEAYNRRAIAHFVAKDYGSALADLRQALALDPNHYAAIAGLGQVMQELGQPARALDVFRRALAAHPHLAPALQAVKDLTIEVEGQGI